MARVGSDAPCNHEDPVCDDCYPNGCPACEWQEHETLRHREEAANRIRHAAHELRVGADDLSDTDLRELRWQDRNDVLKQVEETIESLRRVRDVIRADTPGVTS